ncbi:glutathione transferase [Irpex rosettiformis]|uniref:Glutathione transferase n=1 Tax=Irpex rosettiformis TaxID=378272 RepID=A0ACB8UD73_9APHY|nr:glutathione transferase [Irpex rosettiformis]
MVLKLVGNPLSTCTRRVAIILKEKQVPFEFVLVDFAKGEHKSPEFLKNQPFGQVPYIVEDDGFVVYESRAIGRYIALKYRDQGTPLLPDPTDLKAVALFEQAASIEQANFDFYASTIAWEKIFKAYFGSTTNEEVVKEKLAGLEGKLDAYEVILSKQKYLAGDKLTVADLFHLPYGAVVSAAGFDIFNETKRPNLARWWKDISSRESWQAVKDRADA